MGNILYPLSCVSVVCAASFHLGLGGVCACTTAHYLLHHSLLSDASSSLLVSKPPGLIGNPFIQCGGELMVSPPF